MSEDHRKNPATSNVQECIPLLNPVVPTALEFLRLKSMPKLRMGKAFSAFFPLLFT